MPPRVGAGFPSGSCLENGRPESGRQVEFARREKGKTVLPDFGPAEVRSPTILADVCKGCQPTRMPHRRARQLRGLAEAVVVLLVIGVCAMAELQPATFILTRHADPVRQQGHPQSSACER